MRASLRGRDELAARVQQALALPTKKEAEHIVHCDRELGNHPAQQSGNEWVHAEVGHLREVLSPAQAGDSEEDSLHGTDDTDEGQTEDQVCQSGLSTAARESTESGVIAKFKENRDARARVFHGS